MAEKKTSDVLSADEKKALRDRAAELKREARNAGKREAGLADVLETIAGLPEPDKTIAAKIHEIVTEHAPHLDPKTWYSFPAYARDGKVVVFFKPASKFTSRYATLGFEEAANLDDGAIWPTSYAVLEITPEVEALIVERVKLAAS